MSGRPISEIRIWSVQDRRSNKRYARPWIVRWAVDDKPFQRGHRTRVEADRYRSLLLVAQREGKPFDETTGEPAGWAPKASDQPLLGWARTWLAESWEEWQPRTQNSAVEALSRFVPLTAAESAPDTDGARRYLVVALHPDGERDPEWEAWFDKWCPSLAGLDRSLLSRVDAALSLGLSGKPLAPNTATRLRTVARSCVRRAVDLELLDADPWPPTQRGAKHRKVRRASTGVDVRSLPNPETMRKALAAIVTNQPASRTYHVMTSVLYYAGLRPSEVVMLRPRHLDLGPDGWGTIRVEEADISFDESGEPKTGKRSVPIPPTLVTLLSRWIREHGFQPDDLLFRTRTGQRPTSSNWGRAWHRALRSIDHEPLRLYDCRHAAATTWLNAGVPLGDIARRLGHSVDVLVSTYVGALRGDEAVANEMIERYLGDVA